ncbi:avidin/streptavidin family protein [Mesorhizobium ciceri]|uniref:avidin/streptavidin family protein n=1 Tax=Mesorhizobium TaxID=68287 RepID=UPI0018CC5A2A|nr:avidin/streptavidin family protein [Mesorhizobium ciceri]
MRLKLFLRVTAAAAILPHLALAQTLPVPSTWINERGSVLTVQSVDASSGKILGNFTNNAPNTACLGTPGFDLAGKIENDDVKLYVTFKNQSMDCRTITLWTGKLAGDKITTIWELVYLTPDGFSTATGSDTFTKQ